MASLQTHCMGCCLTGGPVLRTGCPNCKSSGYDCQGIRWDDKNKRLENSPFGIGIGMNNFPLGPYFGKQDEVEFDRNGKIIRFTLCKCFRRLDVCREGMNKGWIGETCGDPFLHM